MPRRLFISIVFIVSFNGAASAQTTQPAVSERWTQCVARLADALTRPADDGSLSALLRPGAVLRRFGHNGSQSVDQLRDRTAGQAIIASLAYMGSPATLASDLAAVLRDRPPADPLKRLFVPANATDLKHADSTAAAWINSVLRPGVSDPVGVIVLVPDGADPANDSADHTAQAPQLLLVLVEGSRSEGNASLVVFGDPRQSP